MICCAIHISTCILFLIYFPSPHLMSHNHCFVNLLSLDLITIIIINVVYARIYKASLDPIIYILAYTTLNALIFQRGFQTQDLKIKKSELQEAILQCFHWVNSIGGNIYYTGIMASLS